MNEHLYHEPVLVAEVLDLLKPQPGKLYLDATFGGGGHTKAILQAQPECSVVALDWDKQALEINGPALQDQFPDRLQLCWGSFAIADRILKKEGITTIDGVLADFGTSQYQLKHRDGFSFFHDSPLDMRMSPGHGQVTAAMILNRAPEKTLREIFWEYGQENNAKKIAAAIVAHRAKRPFVTTLDLARVVESVVPRKGIHPATKVFQALRIYINKELDNIRSFFPAVQRILSPGSRLVVITFHSLEDHIVKHYFREQESLGTVAIVTPSPVSATEQEVRENPSSRSAKIRAVEILAK
jgi:16S rRNA (cytosine1402-N4)-methyltransferase